MKTKAIQWEREREEEETQQTQMVASVCALTQKGVTTFCLLVVEYIYDGWHNVQVQYQVITINTRAYAMQCPARGKMCANARHVEMCLHFSLGGYACSVCHDGCGRCV